MIRDFMGRLLRCPQPRVYPDVRAPDGFRREPCRTNGCVVCFLDKVLVLISALSLAPLSQTGFVTLVERKATLAEDGAHLRKSLNGAFAWIRRESGLVVPRAQVAELSDDLRPHAHFVTRGAPVSKALFEEACSYQGLGHSSIEAVRGKPEQMARYLYKTVMPPPGEDFVADVDDLKYFLILNGGRALETHGEMWVDLDGTVFSSAREGIKAARRDWRAGHEPE